MLIETNGSEHPLGNPTERHLRLDYSLVTNQVRDNPPHAASRTLVLLVILDESVAKMNRRKTKGDPPLAGSGSREKNLTFLLSARRG